ncbi:hypothetical protein [Halobellus limi]|uniref:Uncharacterized protein n=1 Tax=Halobellus limi TaxID=699433 RepID=A0A1H6BTE5_9EURY|nr:hypothetical protein [Halobellus limi]QCC49487.1 hypothetical protein DV707_17340 [Halobellus limi]SEG63974.1 hypothetical protein SAMN04488133_3010 [Halobellus limi]
MLFLFVVAGLLFESWSVSDFLSHLTIETIGWLLLSSGMVIATVGIPIALYFHSRLAAPVILLGVIVFGWLTIGIGTGTLQKGALFGLSLYAVGLSPVYIFLYLAFGGGEYYVRTKRKAELNQ